MKWYNIKMRDLLYINAIFVFVHEYYLVVHTVIVSCTSNLDEVQHVCYTLFDNKFQEQIYFQFQNYFF